MSGPGYKLFKAALGASQAWRLRRVLRSARSPRETQEALLRRILAANAQTEFGKTHGFSRVTSVSGYRRAVPVRTYEDLRSLIERQESNGDQCLTHERPVYYHRTSGTVGIPKNIPLTASGLAQMKQDQRLSAYVWARDCGLLEGRVFAISGAAVEGKMAGGDTVRLRLGTVVSQPVAVCPLPLRRARGSVGYRRLRRPLSGDGDSRIRGARRDRRGDGEPVHVSSACSRWLTTTPTRCSERSPTDGCRIRRPAPD